MAALPQGWPPYPSEPETRRQVRALEGAVRAALAATARMRDKHPHYGRTTTSPVRLLAAVSGGPDSMCLAHAVARVLRRWRGAPAQFLFAGLAYIDHGIRPSDVVAMERTLVEATAGRLGVPFFTDAADTPDLARREGRSLEDAARTARYRLLARLAADAGADMVLTGHTRSDQAETVMLRLIRGTGVHGLAAMRLVSGWPVGEGPRLVRPLLAVSRSQTAVYCAALSLQPATDQENASPRYRRNRIRRDVLPVIADINPRIEQALARLAERSAPVSDLIRQLSDELWQRAVVEVGTGVVGLAYPALASAHPALRREVLERSWRELAGATLPPAEICAVADRLDAKATGQQRLSGGGSITWSGGQIMLSYPAAGM